MAIDLASNTEVVRDEIAWLERRLSEFEDWRALGQLQAREARGEGLNAVDGQHLKALLLQSLSANPLFERHSVLLGQTGRALDVAQAKPASVTKPAPQPAVSPDDLVRIRGISKTLARRLSGVGVLSFSQIANWTSADVQHVAKTLGIGRQISSENWIEQAALLARSTESSQPLRDIATQAKVAKPVVVAQPVVTVQIAVAPLIKAEIADHKALAGADVQVQPTTFPTVAVPAASVAPPAPLAARNYASTERGAAMTVADALAILGFLPLKLDDAERPGLAEPEAPFAPETVVSEPVVSQPVPAEPVTAEPVVPEQPSFEVGPPPMPLPAAAFAMAAAPQPEEVPEDIFAALAAPPAPVPASRFHVAREIVTAEAPPVSLAPPLVAEAAIEPVTCTTPMAAEVIANEPVEISPEVVQDVTALPVGPEFLPAPPLPLSAAHYATGWTSKRRVEREHWMVDTASELRAIERLLAQPMPGQFKSAPEAKVTIKRGPEPQPKAALQPAPIDVPARRPPSQPAAGAFDGGSYAAYRDHIEEASVEIVKHRESADTAQPPPPLPEPHLRPSAAFEMAAKSTLNWFVRAMKRA